MTVRTSAEDVVSGDLLCMGMRWFAAADCTLTWCVAIAKIRRCDSIGSPLTS